MMDITGVCFCKKIRYSISSPILKMGICYCNSCRHLSGGSSWPFIIVKNDALQIIGDLKEFTRTGGSGNLVHNGFCDHCSTTLFGRLEVWPHIRTISASSLDNPLDFAPQMQVWCQDAPSWTAFNPDVPQFVGNPN
jgi:hypothetical protein